METKKLIDRLGSTIALSRITDWEWMRKEVLGIQEAFRSLPRAQCTVDELVSLKYSMQHWRQKVFALVSSSLSSAGSHESVVALAILGALELRPSRVELEGISQKLNQHRELEVRRAVAQYFATVAAHELIAQKDEKTLHLAGPSRTLPIEANAPSRCTEEKWSKFEDLSHYSYEGEGVRYRGLHFLPGDMLVCNVNRDGNGIYTALCTPRSYGYHLGVFAVIEKHGRRFPVIVETYKLGVRLVPLCAFLTDRVLSYAEVYRLKDRPEGFSKKLNRHAAEMPGLVRGYNFDTEDPDRSYLSCTTVATQLLELSGASGIVAKSAYLNDPISRRNLEILEFLMPAFLSLTDFLVDERTVCVGTVDNGHFEANVARELVERHFIRIFRAGIMDLGALPAMYRLNLFGVKQMRAGGILGRLIGMPYGLTQDNLPRGSEQVLATVELFEHMFEAAVRRTIPQISAYWDRGKLLNIDQLTLDPAIGAILRDPLSIFLGIFKQDQQLAFSAQ